MGSHRRGCHRDLACRGPPEARRWAEGLAHGSTHRKATSVLGPVDSGPTLPGDIQPRPHRSRAEDPELGDGDDPALSRHREDTLRRQGGLRTPILTAYSRRGSQAGGRRSACPRRTPPASPELTWGAPPLLRSGLGREKRTQGPHGAWRRAGGLSGRLGSPQGTAAALGSGRRRGKGLPWDSRTRPCPLHLPTM